MAYDTRSLSAYIADNAGMQAWVTALDDQIQDSGMVYVPQSGDLTPGSATRPSTNSSAGFRIYRFDDGANQTALPIYVRIEYRVGSAQTNPTISARVGTGVDGSGGLGGQVGTATTLPNDYAKSAGNTLPSYCSHGDGYFHLVTNLDNASSDYSRAVLIERPFESGVPTDEGIWTWYGQRFSSARYLQTIKPTGTVTSQVSSTSAQWQPNGGSASEASYGSKIAFWPAQYLICGKVRHTRALMYKHALVSELVPLDGTSGNNKITYAGSAKSYLPLGDGAPLVTDSSSESFAIAMD